MWESKKILHKFQLEITLMPFHLHSLQYLHAVNIIQFGSCSFTFWADTFHLSWSLGYTGRTFRTIVTCACIDDELTELSRVS